MILQENISKRSIHKIPSGIYWIICFESAKFYVGSAVNICERWNIHKHHLRKGTHGNRHLQCSWNKYGEDGFGFFVIEYVEETDQLLSREQYWIDCLNPELNIMKIAKSRLGVKCSPETIEKIRITSTGRKRSQECKDKYRATRLSKDPFFGTRKFVKTGILGTQAWKDKISSTKKRLGQKGPIATPEIRQKLREAMLRRLRDGTVHTEESRMKQRIKMLGRRHSIETRLKMSASRKGVKFSPEHCEAISLAKKLNPSGFMLNKL
jgi:group I intron endonuclease